jgi:hypothetical protein
MLLVVFSWRAEMAHIRQQDMDHPFHHFPFAYFIGFRILCGMMALAPLIACIYQSTLP